MLTNGDIEDLFHYYNLPNAICCMKNELPNKIKNNTMFIINLESSNEGNGSHWTALFVKNNKALYCDSFGMLPPEEVIDFVKSNRKMKLCYNEVDIQDLKSELCGWFFL
jgi:hypothetical protein